MGTGRSYLGSGQPSLLSYSLEMARILPLSRETREKEISSTGRRNVSLHQANQGQNLRSNWEMIAAASLQDGHAAGVVPTIKLDTRADTRGNLKGDVHNSGLPGNKGQVVIRIVDGKDPGVFFLVLFLSSVHRETKEECNSCVHAADSDYVRATVATPSEVAPKDPP